MTTLLTLPVLIPLAAAALCLLAWGRPLLQKGLGLIGPLGQLIVGLALLTELRSGGVLAVQLGGWPAPFGVTLVADLFSAIMVVLTGAMGLLVALYAVFGLDAERENYGFYSFFNALLMGVAGAFLAGDIFNLYVWFEVLLMASFVLLALGGERAQIEGSIKYLTLNLVSSGLFLAALGILYGLAGSLNFADLALKIGALESPRLATAVAMLFLAAFGIKAALFPLFFWLPASYHTPPAAVSAIFAGLLTKVGVYALIRVFTLIFVHDPGFTHALLLVLAGATMVVGVLGAAAQNEMRRILSFHSISQVGYMVMGLGLFSVAGLAGAIFFIVHHSLVKSSLFLISGVIEDATGSTALAEIGGLKERAPLLSFLFLISAFSLAGVPPLFGFFAKLALIKAAIADRSAAIVAVALAVSLLTTYSMTKIWLEAFWKPAPEGMSATGARRALLVPIAILAGLTVLLGLLGGPLFELAQRAAEQLMDPSPYIRAVLGEGR